MNDAQKPIRLERVHTICQDYNSSQIEGHVDSLMKRLRRVLPHFWVNIAYKTKTIYNLFSASAKPVTETFQTANVCYQFTCPCNSTYIGHTERPLIERVQEHQQLSNAKGIYWHIHTCNLYKEKAKNFEPETGKRNPSAWDKHFVFFKSHFRIIEKRFRSCFERRKTEAYYIRIKRPDLNDQKEHVSFSLF